MISFTPQQIADYLTNNFEMDYWGVSYKQAFEYVANNDSNNLIKVAVENYPGEANLNMLKPHERNRFKLVSKEEANYFITNLRWASEDYGKYEQYKFHSIVIDRNTVVDVFKFR